MKLKIMILILLSSLILGCRTAKRNIQISHETKSDTESINSQTTDVKIQEVFETQKSNKGLSKKENNFSGDIIIKGKSDSTTPLYFHNVLNGDTLQSILIKGNADYYIHNTRKKSNEKYQEKKDNKKTSSFEHYARETVSKKNIKEVATEIEDIAKNIESKSFSFGSYIIIIIWGIFAVVFIILILWVRKKGWLSKILNLFNNK